MPDRITLRRTKGWRLPPNTRVVTRATIFGNPFKAGNPGRILTRDVDYPLPMGVDQARAVGLFQRWLNTGFHPMPDHALTRNGVNWIKAELAARRAAILATLPALRGQNLACFCQPGAPCHADVLLRMATE
jgi:hypothetical protein